MGRIIQLTQNIITKTAAGQIVDRPSSVVKELVENALDAGATKINISVKGGGADSIRVSDNGCGMDASDVLSCYLSHTTSKISTEDDLNKVSSFGFRGEALFSISSVSNFLLKSRKEGFDLGSLIEVVGGELSTTSPVGMDVGTTIEVKDLFFNIPARKKFLKPPKIENRLILDILVKFALAFPNVGFKYISDNTETFDLFPEILEKRIKAVLGLDLFHNLISLKIMQDHMDIHGFLGKPQVAGEGKSNQYLFVNNRPISNPKISEVVKRCFGSLLEPRQQPIYILNIKLPYEMTDVNVHPRKEEIAFHNEDMLLSLVEAGIKEVLQKEDLTYSGASYVENFLDASDNTADPDIFSTLKDETTTWDARAIEEPTLDEHIFQVNRLYLVALNPKSGLEIYDQHAVHERILYEEFLQSFQHNEHFKESIVLDAPTILDFSLSETALIKENVASFESIGLDIAEFGQNTFKISSIPKFLLNQDIKAYLLECLQDFVNLTKFREVSQKTNKTLAYLACRGAIKQGDYLTLSQRQALINKVRTLPDLYTCPHGRPIKLHLSAPDLGRLFKRIH